MLQSLDDNCPFHCVSDPRIDLDICCQMWTHTLQSKDSLFRFWQEELGKKLILKYWKPNQRAWQGFAKVFSHSQAHVYWIIVNENRLYWPVPGIIKPVCWHHIAHLVLAHLFTYTRLSTELGKQETTSENWLFGEGLNWRVPLISVTRAQNWLGALKYVQYCYINGHVHLFECSGLAVVVVIQILGSVVSLFLTF